MGRNAWAGRVVLLVVVVFAAAAAAAATAAAASVHGSLPEAGMRSWMPDAPGYLRGVWAFRGIWYVS